MAYTVTSDMIELKTQAPIMVVKFFGNDRERKSNENHTIATIVARAIIRAASEVS